MGSLGYRCEATVWRGQDPTPVLDLGRGPFQNRIARSGVTRGQRREAPSGRPATPLPATRTAPVVAAATASDLRIWFSILRYLNRGHGLWLASHAVQRRRRAPRSARESAANLSRSRRGADRCPPQPRALLPALSRLSVVSCSCSARLCTVVCGPAQSAWGTRRTGV